MSGLDRHYGTDASLDEATVRQHHRLPIREAETAKAHRG